MGSGPRPRTHLHSCSQTLRALIPLRPDLLRNQPVLRARGLGEFRGLFCSLISASQGLWVSLLTKAAPGISKGPSLWARGVLLHTQRKAAKRLSHLPAVARYLSLLCIISRPLPDPCPSFPSPSQTPVHHSQAPPRPLLLFFPPLFPDAWNLGTKRGPEGSN